MEIKRHDAVIWPQVTPLTLASDPTYVHPQLHKGTEYGLCVSVLQAQERATQNTCFMFKLTLEDGLNTCSRITASNQGPGCKFLHQLLLKTLFNSRKE